MAGAQSAALNSMTIAVAPSPVGRIIKAKPMPRNR